jgi:hypothetical protein
MDWRPRKPRGCRSLQTIDRQVPRSVSALRVVFPECSEASLADGLLFFVKFVKVQQLRIGAAHRRIEWQTAIDRTFDSPRAVPTPDSMSTSPATATAAPAATKRTSTPLATTREKAVATSLSAPATTARSEAVLSSFPLKPLTTTFTPPDGCGLPNIYLSEVAIVDPQSTCLPSSFNKSPTAYYSPGFACPSGYYSACHDNVGVKTITTVTCCPHGIKVSLSCVDPTAVSAIWSTLFCTWIAPSSGQIFSITVSSSGTTSTVASTMTYPEGINAYGVRMVYEATDTIDSNTTSTTTVATASATASNAPPPSSSGLSTGAIAAIAVVIPIVFIAIAIGAFFWWRRRKQKYSSVGSTASPRGDDNKNRTYYDPSTKPPLASPGSELQGNNSQLYAPVGPAVDQDGHMLTELPPSHTPVELPAEGQGDRR